jgi:hypothetical protein
MHPRDLQGTTGWTVGVVVAVVVYVLSPFPVFWTVSRGYGGMDNAPEQMEIVLLDVLYRPLVMAAIEWEPVERVYLGGFELLGIR